MATNVLLFLSEYKDNSEVKTYTYLDDTFEGSQTNEAPFRCIVKDISSNNLVCDKIIILRTETVKKNNDLEKFKERVLKEYSLEDRVEIVDIADNPDEDEIIEKSIEIVNIFNTGDNLYLDISGGYRDFNFFLMAILRFASLNQINLRKAVISNFKAGCIYDRTKIYKMYDYISGADEFVNYGKAKKLSDYYKNSNNPKVNEILGIMKELEEALTLCNYKDIEGIMNKLSKAITKYDIGNSEEDLLFDEFINVLNSEYSAIKSKEKDVLDIIEWCLKKDFIQSALSFWTELVPNYFVRKGFLTEEETAVMSKDRSDYIVSLISDCYYNEKNSEIKEVMQYVAVLNNIRNYYEINIALSQHAQKVLDALERKYNIKKYENQKQEALNKAVSDKEIISKIIDFKEISISPIVIYEIIRNKPFEEEIKEKVAESIGLYIKIKGRRNKIHHANGTPISKDELKSDMLEAIKKLRALADIK